MQNATEINLIFMNRCFEYYSVQIPTRCNLVVEFIIPKFIEDSTCFERHNAHHQEFLTVFVASGLYAHVVTGRCQSLVGKIFPTQPWQRPVTTWVYKPEAEIQFRAPDDERCAARNMSSL
jgi:hypothetical protein